MKNENNKKMSRFSPLRILILCGVSGLTFAGLALIGSGIYGIFTGTAPSILTLGKIVGIGFCAGFIIGLSKI